MAIDLPRAEMVAEISDEQQKKLLKDHFYLAYQAFAANQFVPDSGFETVDGVDHVLTGIPYPFLNVVFGSPNGNDEGVINAQMEYFNTAGMPFAWLIDEGENEAFENTLKENGFQTVGVFRGMIGFLDQPIPSPVLPEGCTIEAVEAEAAMEEFGALLATTFGFEGKAKELMTAACWNATKTTDPTMYHWAIRKEGKMVAIVSSLISGEQVSFWNGATVSEMRKTGLCTALCCFAMQHAISKGCRVGMSYLMAEGLAYGICSKLGSETKWRINVYLPQ